MKGGEENADDIVMTVLGKLVEVLRSGQYTPEKGKFHSYLATMIVNEVHMSHRKEIARASDRKGSNTQTSTSMGLSISATRLPMAPQPSRPTFASNTPG